MTPVSGWVWQWVCVFGVCGCLAMCSGFLFAFGLLMLFRFRDLAGWLHLVVSCLSCVVLVVLHGCRLGEFRLTGVCRCCGVVII